MSRFAYVILGVSALALGACGTGEMDRTLSGAGIGAATGAVVGGPVGALVGAGAGGAAGAVTEADDVNLGAPVWQWDEFNQ